MVWTCLCGARRGLSLPWDDADCDRLCRFLYNRVMPRIGELPCRLIAEFCRTSQHLHQDVVWGRVGKFGGSKEKGRGVVKIPREERQTVLYNNMVYKWPRATRAHMKFPMGVHCICLSLRVDAHLKGQNLGPFYALMLCRGHDRYALIYAGCGNYNLNLYKHVAITIDVVQKTVSYRAKLCRGARKWTEELKLDRTPVVGFTESEWEICADFAEVGSCSLKLLHYH